MPVVNITSNSLLVFAHPPIPLLFCTHHIYTSCLYALKYLFVPSPHFSNLLNPHSLPWSPLEALQQFFFSVYLISCSNPVFFSIFDHQYFSSSHCPMFSSIDCSLFQLTELFSCFRFSLYLMEVPLTFDVPGSLRILPVKILFLRVLWRNNFSIDNV